MTRPRLIALAAAIVVILVAVSIAIVLRMNSPHYQITVLGQIGENGSDVPAADSVTPADPSGDGKAICPPVSIALTGALTGPNAELGNNIKDGVHLAVDKHNAANPGCQVQIKEFNTEGDPEKLTAIAPDIVGDVYTLGMIGPTFSGVLEATGAIFARNGLVAATASASEGSLSQQGWTTFFRAVASDVAQGRAIANYMTTTLGYRKVCVVDDHTPYGTAVAQSVIATLGAGAVADCAFSIALDGTDFGQVVNRVNKAAPDAVLVSGSAALTRRLRDGGVSARFVTADSAADAAFVEQAGDAAEDLVVACPCGPAPQRFADEYRDKFGKGAGTHSAEGYDLATIMLKGIDSGVLTRAQMLDWMRNYDGQGLARRYQWTPTGELTNPTIWIYRVQ